MSRQKKTKSLGCKQSSSISTSASSRESSQKMIEVSQPVSQTTVQNKDQAQVLARFSQLVNEGNPAKLSTYFADYGIDPEFVQLNLDVLIEAEFQDLST